MPNITDAYLQNKKNPKDRKTAEFKHVKTLTKAHVDQAANQYPRFPKEKLLIIPKNTKVPDSVNDYAGKKGVQIKRLRKDHHHWWE